MKVLYEKCAGLDVHKDSVVATFRDAAGKEVKYETKTVGTTTPELLQLHDWLEERACTHVAMESTGVYWKPVWHVLEDTFQLILGNAAHIKNVPGRKTDVNDATWLADLLAHGLIAASIVPAPPQAELRDLSRTRKQLVREAGHHVQRVQKTLEDANIKLASVVSDIQGVTARKILDAIVRGETDPKALAALNGGQLKATKAELEASLTGYIKDRHCFEIGLRLRVLDALRKEIKAVEKRLEEKLESFREDYELLKTIPGWKDVTVQTFLAEVGHDMSRFATDADLVSWIRLCPRSDMTAGKRRSKRIMKGRHWLKPTLAQAAIGAANTNGTYLQATYRRLCPRLGRKGAYVAVAASQVQAAYWMLKRRQTYKELGADHHEKKERPRIVRRLVRRLESMGVKVQVEQAV
jgi:transposase